MKKLDVSISRGTVAFMLLSCLAIVFLLRSPGTTSSAPIMSVVESPVPIVGNPPSGFSPPESVSVNSSLLSKPDATFPTLHNHNLYQNPPSQEWIQVQIGKALSDLHLEYSSESLWSMCGPKTYYFPKIKTIFTGIPKTGCSNWIESLLRAEGELTGVLDPTKIKRVHGPMSSKYRMVNIRMQYNDTTFQKAFSFTVVRNPWTRMVSGYRDKLSDEDTQGNGKRNIGIHIVKEMRGLSIDTVKTEGLYPTFSEYASWLAKNRGRINVHFSPQYSTLCLPNVRYDMVVPLEYASILGGEVLQRIDSPGLSVLGSYDKSSDPRLQKSALYARKWLSELDPDLVEQLYGIFKTDFTLLNYSNFTHPDFPLPLFVS